jgi:hypothetical protein
MRRKDFLFKNLCDQREFLGIKRNNSGSNKLSHFHFIVIEPHPSPRIQLLARIGFLSRDERAKRYAPISHLANSKIQRPWFILRATLIFMIVPNCCESWRDGRGATENRRKPSLNKQGEALISQDQLKCSVKSHAQSPVLIGVLIWQQRWRKWRKDRSWNFF